MIKKSIEKLNSIAYSETKKLFDDKNRCNIILMQQLYTFESFY